MAKRLCQERSANYLATFLACRLIPLHKQPYVTPIRIDEVLRQVIGKIVCPTLATFINNCYSVPSDLFVQGGKRLKSLEGTTQGDPASMGIYALVITPLLACVK